MPKIGDRIRFLNSVGGGIITRIEGQIAYVDDDGFETPTLLRECVVVASAEETARMKASAPDPQPAVAKTAQPAATATPAAQAQAAPETPEGEKLNIVVAFEPQDIKHLNTTRFDTYIVNDSNYSLYAVYSTRADGETDWTARFASLIEPSMQVFMGEIEGSDLPEMDRISLQIIPFKTDRPYRLKTPVSVEMPLDTTKFFKLHCFRESPYFDSEVISLEIVRDDVVRSRSKVEAVTIEEAIKAKRAADRPARKPVAKRETKAQSAKRPGIIEVDLHISELLDTTAGLSPADILNRQVDEFRRVMDANLRNKGQKIVFIHGKGEGILRNALLKELKHRYKGVDVQDASFREYGFGATQVTI
ncbi:MAG: DUF2027 domain-containing protein [Duncaniella sp.]|nr:DUF2027 domain-containing protein [Duncaniella sp.]